MAGGNGGSFNRLTATVVGLVAMAGACSSSGGGAKAIGAGRPTSSVAASPTSSTTIAPAPTTTAVDATKAAILAAYRAAWVDIDVVEGHYPINGSDPRLADHMAGKELNQVRNAALGLSFQGQYLAGPPTDTSAAIVKQLVGSAAVVSDCNVDGSILMDGRTNQVVKPGSIDRTLVNAKMELMAGVWKMTEFSNVGDLCTVPS